MYRKKRIEKMNTKLYYSYTCKILELRLLSCTTFYAKFRINSKFITAFNTKF